MGELFTKSEVILSVKDSIEFLLLCCSLGAIIWRIAEVKSRIEASIAKLEKNIYKDLDVVKDSLENQINLIDKRLDLHAQSSTSERDMLKYQVNGQGERLGSELEKLKRRISGAIVFERLEQRIITLGEALALKNQG